MPSTLYLVTTRSEFLTQKYGMIVMKVKVEDLEGLLTQKHGMIVMKVKVEDLGGSSNIQEYLHLICVLLPSSDFK